MTIVLTGANGSLGVSIVSNIVSTSELAAHHGVYTARNADTATSLHGVLKTSHSHEVRSLDLSCLADVRKVATTINARVAAGEIPTIRALILNAGYVEYNTQQWTEDGLDMSFVSNYLGHWLLTLMLLQSMDREMGRIVVLSSWSYDPNDKRNGPIPEQWKTIFQDGTEPIARGTWSANSKDPSWRTGFRRYGASKLCLVMMIGELQRRLQGDPILSNISILGVDPGAFSSGVARRGPWPIRVLMYQIIIPALAGLMTWFQPGGTLRTPAKASEDVLYSAFDCGPQLGERPKGLYLDGKVPKEMSAEARDVEKREMLWRNSIRYAELEEGETTLANWR
ncbi:NAD(P)-binding protein [Hypoxylon cercidicola]|nr:NAD(P)-binding protein [Hypoxylon cercidicola]